MSERGGEGRGGEGSMVSYSKSSGLALLLSNYTVSFRAPLIVSNPRQNVGNEV